MFGVSRILDPTSNSTRMTTRVIIASTIGRYVPQQRYYSTDPRTNYEDKYREKLLAKAKSQGFNSIEELKASMKETIDSKKKEMNKIDPLRDLEEYQRSVSSAHSSTGPQKISGTDSLRDVQSPEKPFKTLNDYLDLEKVKKLSNQEIEYLWRSRWSQDGNTLSAIVPKDVFLRMANNVRANPCFVLPLPRNVEGTSSEAQSMSKNHKEETGMELHYLQWQFVDSNTLHCMLTSLAEYKLHGQYSRPHTTLEFFTDLLEDKGLALMKGNIVPDSNIQPHDAQLLLLNIQRFYGALGETSAMAQKRLKLLRAFNSGSSDFNVDTLISLAQSMEN